MSFESLFIETLNAQSGLFILLAFAAGVVSSLLPCTIAMLPVLVGYVGGYTAKSKWDILLQVVLFMVGVASVMTILGILASLLGLTFGSLMGGWMYAVIGVVAILMALQLLEVIHIPMPRLVSRLPDTKSGKIMAPLLLGLAFGTAASPCGTPFLAAILGLISREQNLLLGGTSLFFYALGQGLPLLVAGIFTGLLKHMAVLRQVGAVMTKISAAMFMVFGVISLLQGSGHLGTVMRWVGLH